ncbi:hypothetical protein Z947_2832 [Sulfitobacter geojensis]|nr:hypothetical protein Z947_2832 [Sulfitobacter geojensis]
MDAPAQAGALMRGQMSLNGQILSSNPRPICGFEQVKEHCPLCSAGQSPYLSVTRICRAMASQVLG